MPSFRRIIDARARQCNAGKELLTKSCGALQPHMHTALKAKDSGKLSSKVAVREGGAAVTGE